MNICAIICEFNPFHNGHKYIVEEAKRITSCDGVLCIMSGNFTQRGDMCVFDKYTRAKHALIGGADCVIQLPAPFAVAPAEIFALGAIKLLSSLPDVTSLVFGCESGSKADFVDGAHLAANENDQFLSILNEWLSKGESYVKSYEKAFSACEGKLDISKPNNVLGLEYTKAIQRLNADIGIFPVKRIGSGHSSLSLSGEFSSATAIRNNLNNPDVKDCVPDFVLKDFKNIARTAAYEENVSYALFNCSTDDLKRVYGCGEGLENKLKGLANMPYANIIETATSRRYSSARIRRILCANMLKLYADECKQFLNGDLYIKPLAAKKDRADEMLAALSRSAYPVITGVNSDSLTSNASGCFKKDCYEHSLYNFINKTNVKDYTVIL